MTPDGKQEHGPIIHADEVAKALNTAARGQTLQSEVKQACERKKILGATWDPFADQLRLTLSDGTRLIVWAHAIDIYPGGGH